MKVILELHFSKRTVSFIPFPLGVNHKPVKGLGTEKREREHGLNKVEKKS